MKVLFVGGTGVISSACTELCVKQGLDLYLVNRGMTPYKLPSRAKIITADIRNPEAVKSELKGETFDVVVDWISFTVDHVKTAYELFKNITSQYIFISTASAYQKPPQHLPITETEPLSNPFWEYSRNKIYCEEFLSNAFHESDFPITIVRPSHTYDCTKIALTGGYTALNRMRKGKCVIIQGDGTSLWTLTHHRDFAEGFIALLGNQAAIGEAYHITSDEILTWNQICQIFAETINVNVDIMHIPSDVICRYDKEWGDGLLGDKAHSLIFDNSKIKKINPAFEARIPFVEGAKEIVSWYDADISRRVVDHDLDAKMDEIVSRYETLL